MEKLLQIAIDAADIGASMIKQYQYGQPEIDTKVEQVIKEILSDTGYPFLGEETGSTPGDSQEYTWIIDPIDGTANLLRGLPEVAASIGLVDDQFQPMLGVICAPFLEFVTWATMEKNSELGVSSMVLEDAVIAIDWTTSDIYKKQSEVVASKLHRHVCSFRSYGSTATSLCYVALGKLDAFIHVNPCPWDVAAGICIVQSAGGIVTDAEGHPYKNGMLVVSNGKFHSELLDIL